MVVIGTFLAFGIAIMTLSSLSYRSGDSKIFIEVNSYLACESVGYTPGRCDRSRFAKYVHPYVYIIVYLLLGLIPISILNLIIDWQSVKEFCSKVYKIFRRYLSKHNPVVSSA